MFHLLSLSFHVSLLLYVFVQHIDLLIAVAWDQHRHFLQSRRITFLDSMFTSILGNKYLSFRQHCSSHTYTWHPLLTAYVHGKVSGRSSTLQWLKDVDSVYLPMNWGKEHWVALSIDLNKGHINILDPLEDCTSMRKVVSYMSPFAEMLPHLIMSACGSNTYQWPNAGFTFSRVPGLAQNKRGGDCGPLCVKFMELHSHAMTDILQSLSDTNVDTLRMRYAIALFESIVHNF